MPKGLKKKKIENIKKEPGGISRTEKVKKKSKVDNSWNEIYSRLDTSADYRLESKEIKVS